MIYLWLPAFQFIASGFNFALAMHGFFQGNLISGFVNIGLGFMNLFWAGQNYKQRIREQDVLGRAMLDLREEVSSLRIMEMLRKRPQDEPKPPAEPEPEPEHARRIIR